MSQPYKPNESELFKALWQAQSGLCAICGAPMPRHRFEVAHSRLWAKQRPTLDHIRPRAKGGSDAPENLQLAHALCNKKKGARWAR